MKGKVQVKIEGFANDGSRRKGGHTLATDKSGRLRMSSSLASLLYVNGKDAEFYLGFDRETGRIALGSPEFMSPEGLKPVKFDAKRRYASVRSFYVDFDIPFEAAHYEYEDKVSHWMLFRRVTE